MARIVRTFVKVVLNIGMPDGMYYIFNSAPAEPLPRVATDAEAVEIDQDALRGDWSVVGCDLTDSFGVERKKLRVKE